MANETFKDYDGNKKYRKSTGAGSSGDPAVTHVIVDTSALPTSAATSAKQDTIIGHIDSVENLLSSMDGSLGSIDTNFPAAATLADNTANPSTTGVAGYTMVFDGSTWDRWTGAVTVSGVATAANQSTLIGHVDGIESALTTITGHVDGLEGLITTGNGKLDDIFGSTGGIETLADAINNKIPSAASLADNTANPTTTAFGSYTMVFDGSTWDRWQGAVNVTLLGGQAITLGAGAVAGGTQRVTLASDDPGVALLGTIDTDTGNIVTAVQIMDDWDNAASDGASVSGDVAHDTADAGEPVKQGAKAVTSLHGITLVANNDRTDLYAGVDGVQIVRPHSNLEGVLSGNASNTDGTSTQCIAASGDAAVKQYLTSIILTNTSASNIYVEIKSGTTVMATLPLPANSGCVFNPPVPLKPNAANEAWNFDPSAAASTVYCSMIGFKSKV